LNKFFRKIPTTAVPIFLPEIIRSISSLNKPEIISEFEKSLAEWLSVEETILVNKGTTALYLILLALKRLHPDRDEVIYPAYTVPTLKLAFDRAGLKTKVCDVKRETFNMDPESLAGEITNKTLAVVPVHMFGFPMRLDGIFELAGDKIAVIEDACQAPGSRLDDKLVGSFASSSIFSLCKGKNISTYTGGFAAFQDKELAQMVREESEKLPEQKSNWKSVVLMLAYSIAMRPGAYGPLYQFIRKFKSEDVHQDFEALKYTSFQAALGQILLEKLEVINAQRKSNGMFLYEGLKDKSHILIPEIIDNSEPVFNHMPVVFLSDRNRDRAIIRLWDKGIDTARMYLRPNHHIYNLGYTAEVFTNSKIIADGLVTLPTHPFMTRHDLEIILEIVGKSE